MFDKMWNIKEYDLEATKKLQSEIKLPIFMTKLLVARGLSDKKKVDDFLYPKIDNMRDPFEMMDMGAAVERILQASEQNEKVTIFGDYDVDGVTSTGILYHFFKTYLEIEVECYIPDRLIDGYGMSMESVEKICGNGTNLIITVDCGIVSVDEIRKAKQAGVDVIVTDHHQPRDILPECEAIINPNRADCTYGFKGLAGVGVVYKLLQALGGELGLEDEVRAYLPFVAIGTIGDSMPLVDENRIIVKYGLEYIKHAKWIGLSVLMEKAGMSDKPITTMSISYGIVPRLNAAGRLGSPKRALELLLAETREEAEVLAEELNCENTRRQVIEGEIFLEAVELLKIQNVDSRYVNVVAGEGWHHGVTGIVASKLTDKFNRPTIILSIEDGGKIARGSARSIKGFNMHNALVACEDLLERFGGHEMAAGLTIKVENIPKLNERLNLYGEMNTVEADILPYINVDVMVDAEELNLQTAKTLALLEPFGMGNPSPLLCCSQFELLNIRPVGELGKHLKFAFASGKDRFDGISFNVGSHSDELQTISKCRCVFKMEINVWANVERVQFNVVDILDYVDVDIETQKVYNKSNEFSLNREELVEIYKNIKTSPNLGYKDILSIKQTLASRPTIKLNWYKIKRAFDIFEEVGILEKTEDGYKLFNLNGRKFDLQESSIFRVLSSLS